MEILSWISWNRELTLSLTESAEFSEARSNSKIGTLSKNRRIAQKLREDPSWSRISKLILSHKGSLHASRCIGIGSPCSAGDFERSMVHTPLVLRARRGFKGPQGAQMQLNKVSSQIIQAAITVHKELGPGLLESVYQSCIVIELENMGVKVNAQVALPIVYRGKQIHGQGLRLDLLVDDKIVVELKSVEKVEPVHKKQLLTYLRLADKPLGLLINFNEPLLKDGITRIINTRDESE